MCTAIYVDADFKINISQNEQLSIAKMSFNKDNPITIYGSVYIRRYILPTK